MPLHKTPQARDALCRQGPELSQAERRILILCDGKRTRAQVVKMLGADAEASMHVLCEQGFLIRPDDSVPTGTPTASAKSASNALGRLLQRTTTGRPANDAPAIETMRAEEAPHVDAKPQAVAIDAASRRSLAACKMYMLDMLQLQRSMESSALAVDIQTSGGEHELVERLLLALRHLCETTKPSMSERIAQRLHSTLPEVHLPRMDSELALLFAPAVDAHAMPASAANVVPMRRDVA